MPPTTWNKNNLIYSKFDLHNLSNMLKLITVKQNRTDIIYNHSKISSQSDILDFKLWSHR